MNVDIEKTLVIRVIERMELTPKYVRQDVAVTQAYIKETLNILTPFKPRPVIQAMMTHYLCAHDASSQDCMTAWALFLDYYSFEAESFETYKIAA